MHGDQYFTQLRDEFNIAGVSGFLFLSEASNLALRASITFEDVISSVIGPHKDDS